MQDSNSPSKLPAIWAFDETGSYIRIVPVDPTGQLGAASFQLGFPPATFQPDTAGGAGPYGSDANGLLQQVTAGLQWLQAGGPMPFDPTWAALANVGGYPKGAMVAAASFPGAWVSTVDNNTADPDTGGANWEPVVLLSSSLRAGASAFAVYTYSGTNPNGFVAGTASSGNLCPDLCFTQGGSKGLWVCVTSGTASTAVWVQIWNGAGSGGTLQTLANGQCRFTYTNATTATLNPLGGGGLVVNGVLLPIPSPAPTILASACASGVNYVYAAISGGGSMILEPSTTAYVFDSAGNPVKNGDATRALVGWVWKNASNQFTQPLVASWYNRRNVPQQGDPNFSAIAQFGTLGDLGTGGHVSFFVWADEGVSVVLAGTSSSNPAQSAETSIGVDGSVVGVTVLNITSPSPVGGLYAALPGALSEGLHTAMIFAANLTESSDLTIAAMLTVLTSA